jgi:dolichyl-phosphate-mannose-protein mannosyltransferase
MNIRIDLDKRDLLTIVVLSIIFFSLAVWNLGLSQAPVTTWQTSENKSFYVDFGEPETVGTVYFLVKDGAANVSVYTGSPENWNNTVEFKIEYRYYSWNAFALNRNSQFAKFDFTQDSIEIAEMVVLNQDNQRIPITTITGDNVSDPTLSNLIDEQNLVQLPPTYLSETFFDEIYFVRTSGPIRLSEN